MGPEDIITVFYTPVPWNPSSLLSRSSKSSQALSCRPLPDRYAASSSNIFFNSPSVSRTCASSFFLRPALFWNRFSSIAKKYRLSPAQVHFLIKSRAEVPVSKKWVPMTALTEITARQSIRVKITEIRNTYIPWKPASPRAYAGTKAGRETRTEQMTGAGNRRA